MKKILSIILMAVIASAIFTSCKKSSGTAATTPFKCAACTATPDAVAANNTSSKGIYKGILIGSTGTIKFDVMNAGATITAVMVIDGVTANLTSSISWVAGQSYVAPFTGTLNGSSITISFSVDASGANPIITSSNIPGHSTIQFTLVKETSAALVEAFEGTYTSTLPENGTFNILVSRVLGKWGGASRKSTGTSNGGVDGTLDANGNLIQTGFGPIGTLSGDQISGSFRDSNGSTITIAGKRSL